MWIKICGIREAETASALADVGVDAIGLNFCESSPRFVDEQIAAEIVALLPREVTPVGVFVNHTAGEIRRLCRACGLETVQLHGDEPASLIAELREFRVIRAVRTGGDFVMLAATHLAECRALGTEPWAWLVDARSPQAYGGTGETVDWDSLVPSRRQAEGPPLILAGGLTPDNVAAAVRTVRPWGVDVASGVESSPAVKDLRLIEAFVRRTRSAY
jgi:phosphoribosylanthranilate isomerase